jgi:hypothetical protein
MELLAQAILDGQEHQPLRDAVSSALKAIKPAQDEASVTDEFALQQVWSQGKGRSQGIGFRPVVNQTPHSHECMGGTEAPHMVKAMTDLFEMCSLVAALSRHTSHRTNSEANLTQFLTAVLHAGTLNLVPHMLVRTISP